MRKIRELTIFLVPFSLACFGVHSVETSQCIAPLGMESGMIQDRDIRASSSFDHSNVGPHHGRIRSEINGGAWCPTSPATTETKEWIEIDLHTVHRITAAETQGRFGNGQGEEYAENYILEYYRPSLRNWARYRSRTNDHLLKGNFNTYTQQKTVLDHPIWASKIRFLPYSSYSRFVCMRVEVYGCKWNDGIVSYTMPQGDKKGTSWEFYDFAYDGQWDGVQLSNGIGQLVDGVTAPSDFKLPFQDSNLQGWIGWKNDNRENVEIIFEFDEPREFRAVHMFVNNQFLREVQVFRVAKVFFSIDGKKYRGPPIQLDYQEDRIFEEARNVTVKLHNRVGRFVKLQLYFAERWMLLSEVSFESTLALGNFTDVDDEDTTKQPVEGSSDRRKIAANDTADFERFLGVVVGIAILLSLLMFIVVFFIVVIQRRFKNLPRPTIADKATLYGMQPVDLLTNNSEYADIGDLEYAVPLQATYTTPTDTIPKRSSPSEQYYAAVDICQPDFIPPSPPVASPRPARLKGLPRYTVENTYIGP